MFGIAQCAARLAGNLSTTLQHLVRGPVSIWLVAMTVFLFVVVRWAPKFPDARPTPGRIREVDAAYVVTIDDITVRPA